MAVSMYLIAFAGQTYTHFEKLIKTRCGPTEGFRLSSKQL